MFDPSGGASLDFAASTITAMEKMIYDSDNPSSAQCIRGCGYGTINGMLANGGFFDGTNGIWLAGDYGETATAEQKANKYRAFKIPVVGDAKEPVAAQASSAFQMAKLFALMVRGDLFGGDAVSCAKMREYLSGGPGASGPSETFMLDSPAPGRTYSVVSAKLGVYRFPIGGPWSETSILQQSGKMFVVSWSNLSTTRQDVPHIIDVVCAVLGSYVSGATGSGSGSGP